MRRVTIALAILPFVTITIANTSLCDDRNAAAGGPPQAHWTGWLGPQRNGWVQGFELPHAWPKSLTKAWQVEVGTGYGSPLVVNGSVFQHARQGEDEVVWKLKLADGAVQWRKSYPRPFKMGGGGERHGKGPKSCPVYDDGRLFTMSITGVLRAWNADNGDLLWKADYSDRFGKGHPYWGASTSPIVAEKKVVAHFGSDDQGVLVALDVESGKEVWSLGDAGPSYSSPLLATLQGIKQVIEWNHEALVGVDLASGSLLWSTPFPHVSHNQNMPTPTLYDGKVLLGAENRGLHSFEPQLQDGAWVVRKNWSQEKLALDMSSAVINDGLLYGHSHYSRGRLFCLNPATGEILWQGPPRVGQNVTFLSLPKHIIALMDHGQLQVIEANDEQLKPVANYKVAPSDTWAPPVLLNEGFLIKDLNHLTLHRF